MLVFLLFFAFSVGEIRSLFKRKKAHNAGSYSFQFLLHFKETASGKDDVVPIELSRRNSHYFWCILCFCFFSSSICVVRGSVHVAIHLFHARLGAFQRHSLRLRLSLSRLVILFFADIPFDALLLEPTAQRSSSDEKRPLLVCPHGNRAHSARF